MIPPTGFIRKTVFTFLLFYLALSSGYGQKNKDPMATQIITEDLDRFWLALDKAGKEVNPDTIHKYYIRPGSKGVRGFTTGRIKSAIHLSSVVRSHYTYYQSIRASVDSIYSMKEDIKQSLVKLKELYPDAVFPPVYFVIGALNSGGTVSSDGLIIGADMYGRTPITPTAELNNWLLTVLKPVSEVPHIVAHELVHFQQTYNGESLLAACIKEGSADFIAELISGHHINEHIHAFANPKEKELWLEFKDRMSEKDFTGWLYSSVAGRPNDLGYWMGYQITKAYYYNAVDKRKAMHEILHIKNFDRFLKESGYGKKFE